jgi:hypothetical protein
MSNVPFYTDSMRWGNKYGHSQLIDGLAKDGLTDVYDGKAMGFAAEHCASSCGITRAEQDAFAAESYRRAQQAWEKGLFKEEVIPVSIAQRKGDPIVIEKDEEPFSVKFDKIPLLPSAFIKDGTVTAANASTMNDGAAALVLMSAQKAKELGLVSKGYGRYGPPDSEETTYKSINKGKELVPVGVADTTKQKSKRGKAPKAAAQAPKKIKAGAAKQNMQIPAAAPQPQSAEEIPLPVNMEDEAALTTYVDKLYSLSVDDLTKIVNKEFKKKNGELNEKKIKKVEFMVMTLTFG